MNWKGHLALGFVSVLISTFVCYTLSVTLDLITFELLPFVIGWVVGLYSSLLPDIDIKTSRVFNFTAMICLFAMIWFIVSELYLELLALVIFLIIIFGLKHRGITHKWYMAPIVGILFMFIFTSAIVGIFAFFGYVSHIVFEQKKGRD